MSQDLSIEDPEMVFFTTTRTMNSRLWFVNNQKLEERILAYLAKYATVHQVILYSFVIMGNHIHVEAKYPLGNKSAFLRDLNSRVAILTNSHVEEFPGGKLWARRARSQMVPNDEDIKNRFFYLSLNPVSSGLVERISDYPSYNSFSYAISGRTREFKVVNWTDYNNRKRHNSKLTIAECTETYELKFARLPGYEHLSQKEYRAMMLEELERRRGEIVRKRYEEGRGFATREQLLNTSPAAAPNSTKSSNRNTHRPLVLTLCAETRAICLQKYFATLAAYKQVSKRFRNGDWNVQFPKGTYTPSFFSGLAAP